MQNLDEHIKKLVDNSENYYQNEAEKVRADIWSNIRQELHPNRNMAWMKWSLAASILALLALSGISYLREQNKNEEIEKLYAEINKLSDKPQQVITINNPVIPKNLKSQVRTIVLEKINYVRDTVVKIEYAVAPVVKDTIFTQLSPNEAARSDSFASQSNLVLHNVYSNKTEFIFTPSQDEKVKEKRKLFRIRFGSEAEPSDSPNPLSINTKL